MKKCARAFVCALLWMGAAAWAADTAPRWDVLTPYQGTMTRKAFIERIGQRYAPYGAAVSWIEVYDTHALIRAGNAEGGDIFYRLRFAKDTDAKSPAAIQPKIDTALPLKGLRVALEPGHVGGDFARMESRYFQVGDEPPVSEGDLTVQVAKLTAQKLRALGAEVFLVRENARPLTGVRGKGFAEAEVVARAGLVNQQKPFDCLLSIHFDARPWSRPNKPILTTAPSKAHLIISGAYSSKELAREQDRILMLEKALSGSGDTELALAATLGKTIEERTGMAPGAYFSPNAAALPGHPYVWARNLMVTRLYRCPSVLCELYVMNDTADYARIQAGAYPGLREFGGKLRPNIFEDYANVLTEALLTWHAPQASVKGSPWTGTAPSLTESPDPLKPKPELPVWPEPPTRMEGI